MSTTTADLLAELLRNLPPRYLASSDLLSGPARSMATALGIACFDLVPTTQIEVAEGPWLTLIAKDHGVQKLPGELDSNLRTRVRDLGAAITKTNVLAAVDRLLLPFGETATVFEHWEHGVAVDTEATPHFFVVEISALYDRFPGFTLFVPLIGGDPTLDVYAQIVAEVNRLRGSGVPWTLILEDPP